MASENQIAANQANALKSTGPKTAQGKAASRRNALKHGMTCEKENLVRRDARLYEERLERWTKTARPRNDMELYQLASAVRASVNLDRCARNASAELDQRTREVMGHWDGVQTKKLNRAIEFWTTQPADCVAQLEAFTRGCEWLLAQWELLAKALETNACWTGDEAGMAMRLLGKCPEKIHDGDREVAAFRSFVVAALPDIDPDEADAILCVDTSELEPEARRAQCGAMLPSREDAIEGLWAIYGAELERVADIRKKLWDGQDGPRLTEKIDLVAFDDSKNGTLRRRYESANHLDMHRCLKQLTEQRRQREARAEDALEDEEKAKAERKAARMITQEQLQAARLRNEAKLSEAKSSLISTSGKSAGVDPRDIPVPPRHIQHLLRPQEAVSDGAPPPDVVAPVAGDVKNPT